MALVKCPECGKEISDKAKACIHCGYEPEGDVELIVCEECGKEVPIHSKECLNCGCPVKQEEYNPIINNNIISNLKRIKKITIPIVALTILLLSVSVVTYNIKVIQPKKIAEQNKITYNEAIDLLEKGKYDEGKELLETIPEYDDVPTILEQIKWESRVYECITDIRQYLKNPDSLQVYEVAFYDGYKTDVDDVKKTLIEDIVKLGNSQAICVLRRGGQNGFGGNTTGYTLFLYSESEGLYKYLGSCDSLNEDDIDEDDKEEVLVCDLINIYKDNLKQVGEVDLARIKAIIKNDSYSTIKIIK